MRAGFVVPMTNRLLISRLEMNSTFFSEKIFGFYFSNEIFGYRLKKIRYLDFTFHVSTSIAAPN